jgi:hypothetical protein
MTIPSYIQDHHIHLAASALSTAKTDCNSTKFFVSENGHKVAPKRIISLAAFLACGAVLPVSRFSGGKETNNRLKRAGLVVREFEPQVKQLELDLNN